MVIAVWRLPAQMALRWPRRYLFDLERTPGFTLSSTAPTISMLAESVGLKPDMLRYDERLGLLPPG